jgi:hypothetical protein
VDLSWSPDGKRIAIASLGPNASVQTATCAGLPIYLVPVDGTAPTAVRGASAGCSVAWSPRGSEIAYEGRGGVWVVRPDGSGRRQVSPNGGGWVRWSADGKKLAFSVAITKHGRVTGRYRGIGDTDANGKRHRLITRRADNEYPAAWSPLGRRILYGRTNAGGGIYTIRGDGRNALRVTNDSPPGSEWPALGWSPNARAIVYTTPTNNGDLYIAGANGRGKVQLTNTADFDNSPSWVANELAATTHGGRAAAAPTGGGTGRSSGPSVPLASLPDGNGAQAFAFDRRFPNIVYIASARASGGVYVFKTIDGGQHWRSTGAHGMGWESDILSLTIDPRHRATLYAGTDTAVYKTTNGGRSWRPFLP